MKILCPNCGKPVVVNGLGRKPLNIPLNNICEALRWHSSVEAASQELGCSQGYIFNVLKANGLKLRDIYLGNTMVKTQGQKPLEGEDPGSTLE